MKDIRVASVQFNHRANDKAYNFAVIERYIQQANEENVELILFPEMCLTGYMHLTMLTKHEIQQLAEPVPEGSSTQKLLKLAKQNQMSIGAGLIEEGDDGKLYNTFILAMPNGEFAKHRKLHTFISEHMSSGSDYTVVDTPHGCRVGILTCWDNNLVENARMTALKGADILLAPHQTGGCDSRSPNAMGLIDPQLWHNRAEEPHAIRAEMQGKKGRGWLMRWLPSRAHDNGMFLVFSNGVGVDEEEVRTGNAMILSPYGETIVETDSVENDMVVATLNATDLDMCTGRRWIRGRRPDLYQQISQPQGNELSPHQARYAKK
ncbi:nitrilase-related carbon-nitrogen hydrolase [uncultured Vibrio sp.]|uniref:nitrilase-related carbon-nitrogen hydrolase n=1 Tax=uncultured Vibrio sp. TaxID=114054 RepID=UPI000913264E|nr:nitrilase-related carbon-nitrogen hydrolase [uncultured Vibrio sp.]OIQ26546.1 MAG: acyltransferase [Vibrio sp. MedPE-SWchi]